MISAILIYGQRGEILASRIYRPGLRRAITDAFRVEVISAEESTPPVLMLGSTTFLHIVYNGLFVVAVTRYDVDAVTVFEFLHELCEICRSRFGTFDESACYTYVTQIYEILDELVDFGFVQNREDSALELNARKLEVEPSDLGMVSSLKRTLSTKPSLRSRRSQANNSNHATPPSPTENAWRKGGVKHRRNEVYLDVVETLNCVFNEHSEAESSTVSGVVKFKAHLSGLPSCTIAFNRATLLGQSQLHSCIDAPRFHSGGRIVFTPPEGAFDLLRYQASGIAPPIELGVQASALERIITVRCSLDARRFATDVIVTVPASATNGAEVPRAKCSSGKARYSSENSHYEWRVGRLTGQNEATLSLLLGKDGVCTGVVGAHFTLSMYTCTGLKVESLTVTEDSKYSTMKWVRYESKGECELRV